LIDGRTKSTYVTNYCTPEPNELDCNLDEMKYGHLQNIREIIEEFKFEKLFEVGSGNIPHRVGTNSETTDFNYTLLIAENKRHECPNILIKV